MMFSETIHIFPENHMKRMSTLCQQNAEVLNVKARGIYDYCWQYILAGEYSGKTATENEVM